MLDEDPWVRLRRLRSELLASLLEPEDEDDIAECLPALRERPHLTLVKGGDDAG